MHSKSAGALLLGVLLLAPIVFADEGEDQAKVTAPVANVRFEPNDGSAVVVQTKAGQILRFLQEEGDWILVDVQGKRGYVPRTLVQIIPKVLEPPAEGAGPSIDHKPIECIVAEQFPKLDAGFLPKDIARGRVYFRAVGQTHWYWVAMTAEAGRYAAVLPKPKKDTKKIDYYVEGLDKASLEGRTKDYEPEVVLNKEQCSRKIAAKGLQTARVLVGGDPGLAAVPAGFEALNVVAAAVGTTVGTTAAAAAGGHAVAIIAGGVAVAGGATAVVVATKKSCTSKGFTFKINYGFTGNIMCSDRNAVQQAYQIDNETCSPLTVTALSVSYAFAGQCTGSVPRTENLQLNGATTIQQGQTATIRTGAPPGQAATFCCVNGHCGQPATCTVMESFNVKTSAGSASLSNSITVSQSGTNCPSCPVSKADSASGPMCFVGDHP
jgi:hypothetical protein